MDTRKEIDKREFVRQIITLMYRHPKSKIIRRGLQMKSKVSKVLIIISMFLIVTTPICFGLAALLEEPTNGGPLYLLFAGPFSIMFVFAPLPCLIMSIIGTIFAAKNRSENEGKSATVWLVLGVICIVASALWLMGIATLAQTW